MQTITILRGLPASGKSTYAKNLVKANPGIYKRINRDDLREMFDGYQLSRENEKFVKKIRDVLIREALKANQNVIVDDTNLSERNMNRIQQLADIHKKETGNKVEVEVINFEIELDEAIKRDASRERPVGRVVIEKLHRQFYAGTRMDERGPNYCIQDKTLPAAIICDLDGTLAIMNGRNPFDASSCENDLLNEPIAEIVRNYYQNGTAIIMLSGRTDNYMEETKRWLEKNEIPYHKLLMRKKGDSRKDAIIKKEIVNAEIKNKYFVRFVLDDRNQVVDMWRNEIGYACLQVNYGDF
ncbi:polynucleotide kinase [Marivirga lumbricoides]|uniref:Polynucleotide kinase n=1 Tax=Marivirga lumbricoides TaxID=1046115 RepID=A0A2T4DU43_9BACT|nr:polynucleotide kinase [Marivirga lumbricoides]